ncbi:MAG: class I SAM-dependent methyltransferase [Eubacteriales bacterium]|nr:class I SAM-dependent methyltransferase [Eubacteriales bacterium]
MTTLSTVSKTLFIPMWGRIYAAEHFPHILYDEKALSIRHHIPATVREERQSQYACLASAVRSANMDRFIAEFMTMHGDAVVVEIGCGLETTFWRCREKAFRWYCVDLPDVMTYRATILPAEQGLYYMSASMFDEERMRAMKNEVGDRPVLFVVAGVFHYFDREKIINLLKTWQSIFPGCRVLFDTLNKKGVRGVKRYMKRAGHKEAVIYFYVDDAKDLVAEIGGSAALLSEGDFYEGISRAGMRLMTRLSMNLSDRMHMVKMIQLKL